MDTRNLAEQLDLEPLPFSTAREVVGVWEVRWWEAMRTALVTDPGDKEHGDVEDPAEAVRIATQWCGRAFNPGMVEFFAINLTGLRLVLDRLMADEHRRLEERVDVLSGMVRETLDAPAGTDARSDARLSSIEEEVSGIADRIAELRCLVTGGEPGSSG